MTDSEICTLKGINSELKQIWIQTQQKITAIELEHPDFKKKFEKADSYERYVFMQHQYSLVSLIQGFLEKFIDVSDKKGFD